MAEAPDGSGGLAARFGSDHLLRRADPEDTRRPVFPHLGQAVLPDSGSKEVRNALDLPQTNYLFQGSVHRGGRSLRPQDLKGLGEQSLIQHKISALHAYSLPLCPYRGSAQAMVRHEGHPALTVGAPMGVRAPASAFDMTHAFSRSEDYSGVMGRLSLPMRKVWVAAMPGGSVMRSGRISTSTWPSSELWVCVLVRGLRKGMRETPARPAMVRA